jgi:hypothetical protein
MATAIPCRTLHNTFLQKADGHPNEHPEPARQPAIRQKRRSNDVGTQTAELTALEDRQVPVQAKAAGVSPRRAAPIARTERSLAPDIARGAMLLFIALAKSSWPCSASAPSAPSSSPGSRSSSPVTTHAASSISSKASCAGRPASPPTPSRLSLMSTHRSVCMRSA